MYGGNNSKIEVHGHACPNKKIKIKAVDLNYLGTVEEKEKRASIHQFLAKKNEEETRLGWDTRKQEKKHT
jgi:hypothetical protein